MFARIFYQVSCAKLAILVVTLSNPWLVATGQDKAGQDNVEHDLHTVNDTPAMRAVYERAALTELGNPDAGRKLFLDDQRGKCSVCHRVDQVGGMVGPELTQIGGKFDRPHLIESLLEPSRQIVEGFRTSTLLTDDGSVVAGIIKSRSDKSVLLINAEGKSIELAADKIVQEKTADVSIMPVGLAASWTPSEFVDLVAYLESLRTGGAVKPGEGIRGPIQLPTGFQVKTIATGLSGAVALETLPDGRILICEQTGTLRIIRDRQLLTEPFATLPVHVDWERGLIGVTIDPDFENNHFVYVCYVTNKPFVHHVISRLVAAGDVAQPGSEQVLIEGDDQSKLGGKVPAGHQGGALHFGSDGCLYIAIGEQTAGLPSQHLDTFQGKLLRIHADGTIPIDNPLLDQTTGKYQSIWAYGLRNPFTFAFHPRTGELLINDVGGEFEEINRGHAGKNYGWPVVEHGPTSDPRFLSPIHVYPQASISGGDFVPEDCNWPQQYQGKYLFADFVHGWIHAIDSAAADAVSKNDFLGFTAGLRRPVDMRFGNDGCLYVLLRNAWVIDGKFQPGTSSLIEIRYEAVK